VPPVLICRNATYRGAQTDRVVNALRAAGREVIVHETATHQPPIEEIEAALAAAPERPEAVVRWEEQGVMFGARRGARLLTEWLWGQGVAPLSLDYGILDHYAANLLDVYRPDGRSHILDEWIGLPETEPEWTSVDPRLAVYVDRVRSVYAVARSEAPPAEPGYVAVFVQCFASLARWPTTRGEGGRADRIADWVRRAYAGLSEADLRVVLKLGPIGTKARPNGIPEDVPCFRAEKPGSDANVALNARIAVHARNVLLISSSVSNEFLLAGVPVLACGRSWFNGLGVFTEPHGWKGVADLPAVDPSTRNRYLHWLAAHQFYPDTAAAALDARVAEFHALRETWAARTLSTITTVYAPTRRLERIVTECLTALLRETPGAQHLAAVDSARPEFVETIRQFGFEVVTLNEGEPPRMTRLMEAALKRATGRRILTVENDVVLRPGCARRLAQVLDSQDEQVLAVEAIMRDGKGRPTYPSLHRVRRDSPPWRASGTVLVDTRHPTYCATLWRREALDGVEWGALPPLLWADRFAWEQITARRHGAVALQDREAAALHHGHASRDAAAGKAKGKASSAPAVVPTIRERRAVLLSETPEPTRRAVLLNDTAYATARVRHDGCHATMAGLEQLLTERGIEVVGRVRSDALLGDLNPGIEAVRAGELVVVNGEGSLHHDSERASAIARIVVEARREGWSGEAWIVNHENYHCKPLARYLAEFQYLAARDALSAAEYAEHGRWAALSADCSLLHDPAVEDRRDIMLVCSGTRVPDPAVVARYATALALEPVFLNSFFPNFPEGLHTADWRETFGWFARARFAVSSSFHGCQFAGLHGVPFAPQPAATPKTRVAGVEWMGELAPLADDHRTAAANLDALTAEVRRRLPAMRARARLNVPAPTLRERFESSTRWGSVAQEWPEIEAAAREVRARRPRVFVEIGSRMGGSLYVYARECAPGAMIVAVDPGSAEGDPPLEESLRRLRAEGYDARWVRGMSADPATLAEIRTVLGPRRVEFLHVDGDHRRRSVLADWEAYRPLLADDALVAFHDVTCSRTGVPQAWREISAGRDDALEIVRPVHSWRQMGIGLIGVRR